ncbi:pyruvate dehydrogenase E1 component subunit alpha, putative [Plasmodium gallinaceum]|uniref:Pyruvate dehydrogenase E1 component subunit alpha, putative n=1 Tax=Plasmodium gallinaceum TaxID=5849 RepID=A0A1J1GUY2_PLAGA|nr:pyruvate dehydrogenase E1 component subunit alpha, putative [Plasmodium gallinaceum]CRG96293.1 pyruvate dehydrogenase E1 component subunit alpha, putative [Plasmodium gallinaceum]
MIVYILFFIICGFSNSVILHVGKKNINLFLNSSSNNYPLREILKRKINSTDVKENVKLIDNKQTSILRNSENKKIGIKENSDKLNNKIELEKNKKSYIEDLKNYFDFNIYLEENKLEEYVSDINVSKEEMCVLYEDMHLGRLFENLVAKLYYNKKVNGFVHLYNGQEAISSGIIKNLRNSDYVTSTYRDHVHAISKNVSPNKILNELYGNYYGSTNKGKGGSMHIFSKKENFIGGFGFIGEQIPIAVGLAYSILYKKDFSSSKNILEEIKNATKEENNNFQGTKENDIDVVVCFLGDGTTNIGQFFESLNLASTFNLPIIFVIENNNWAIGMESSRSSINDLMNNYSKGKAFNIDSYKLDGNDVLTIYKLTKKKIDQIRKRKCGPVLIEAITYRQKGHSLADPDELRKSEEKSSWKKRDPLVFLSNYMKRYNIVEDSYFEEVKKRNQKILKDIENDAEENKKKSENINICDILKENIFAPSQITPYQNQYENYQKYDELSNSELKEYYEAYLKENQLKKEKKKADINEKFNEKKLPLIID